MPIRFEKLLAPGKIGPVVTRNRMIKTAGGGTFLESDQTCGPETVAFYECLAKGGVGFLVVESCSVEYPLGAIHVWYREDGGYQGAQLRLDDDRFIAGFRRLTDAVHRHGCPVSIQLQHAGPWNPTGILPADSGIRNVKCASTIGREALPGPHFLSCREMTKDEIEAQIDHWADAAERAWRAGFDACEINHGTCHQGNTFLSRVWNHRRDEFGPQSYENRTRFLRRCIEEIRRRTGPGFAVHVLLNIVEYNHPLGTTMEEGVEMARLAADVADGINCRAEFYGHAQGLLQPDRLFYPEPPRELPRDLDWRRKGKGATVPLVEAVKAAGVVIPVWTACRLDPVIGEEYLEKGSLDFVGMTRRILADPELPNKVREGRLEDIRCCHGCLHCMDVRNKNKPLECRVNATLGRELCPELQFVPTGKKRKVMVVGGGPAGMEAARVAAGRGHAVSLYEKAPQLGGLLPFAAVVKDLECEDILQFRAYMETQLQKEGVQVHLKQAVDRKLIVRNRPDVLVIAAGAVHTAVDFPGGKGRKVLTAEKLYRKLAFWMKFFSPSRIAELSKCWMPLGKNLTVAGSGIFSCELAEFLAKRGRSVTIVHNGPREELWEGMHSDDLASLRPWFKQKGVSIWSDVLWKRLIPEGLEIRLRDRACLLKVDQVITTGATVPEGRLMEMSRGVVDEVHVIGAAAGRELMVDAILEGARIGYKI